MMSDVDRLADVFTYVSDNGVITSWLDHIVCSGGIDSRLSDIAVLYGCIGSDHRPLSVTIADMRFHDIPKQCDYSNVDCVASDWSKVDSHVASEFAASLDELLLDVSLPHELFSCCTGCTATCNDSSHRCAIDRYYSDVINCVKLCVELTVPKKLLRIVNLMYLDGVILYKISMMHLELPFLNGLLVVDHALEQFLII